MSTTPPASTDGSGIIRPSSETREHDAAHLSRFRLKLLAAMMLLITSVTAAGLYFSERKVAGNAKRTWQAEFQGELAALHAAQEVRLAALAERTRALARNPRLHAALEDDALDLLYPTARDELADIRATGNASLRQPAVHTLRASYYRFLAADGAVIPPGASDVDAAGALSPTEEARLRLPVTTDAPQRGYLARRASDGSTIVDEVIALPMFSTETGKVIACVVFGFPGPVSARASPATSDPTDSDRRDAYILRPVTSGLWLDGLLHMPALDESDRLALSTELARELAQPGTDEKNFTADLGGVPHLVFHKQLNPGAHYPPAHEVCVYSFAASLDRQRALRWQFAGTGGLLIVGAFFASNALSIRFARPVEKLVVVSEQHRALRHRAEAALEITSEELQRSMRFSADASHQLKTPVTVLRAGLEELLAGEKLAPDAREEISTLVHQTLRLTGVIEDLLLLSRLDSGRLQLELRVLDLSPLIDAWLDDLSALSDGLEIDVEMKRSSELLIVGDRRYAPLILQNLLENARKYNRPGGRIRIEARVSDRELFLTIGNTGRAIPPAVQAHIFERFHRGEVGENIPGHGLGLNLARELARLHGGELRLVRSDETWTEFEVRFQAFNGAKTEGAIRS
jgi:signal transduction histidine kinase